ncbi:MAG: hypothetical protein SPK31_06610 [Alloprevotella sp.]|nr:hypothetical protein [Prevotellamassilia sp.]MDY5762758.1 hypothetical protein [Alloprevotella sp.]
MKKTILFTFILCSLQFAAAQSVYQFVDPGFEQYTADGEPGNGWNSFSSATGKLSSMKGQSPSPKHVSPGANGTNHAVKIWSKSILGVKANGNLTTGIINMGSATPSSASNYNYTKRSDSSHSLQFSGRPDAVTFYARFTSGGSPNGRGQFIIHDGDVDYQDPEVSSQTANRVGKATVLVPASSDWVQYTGEFTYDKARTATQYLLASFTTNPTPGGSAGDYLDIDEINFIYYHELKSLTYDGRSIDLAAAQSVNGYNLAPTTYDAAKLSYVIKGVAATAETDYQALSGTLTITVKGDDFTANPNSKTIYTLFFAPDTITPEPTPEPVPEPGDVADLSASITSLADLSTDKTYVLYNPTYTAFAVSNPNQSATNVWAANMQSGDNSHQVVDASYSLPLDTTSAHSSWMIVPFEGKYYLYNMGAGKFLITPSQDADPAICQFTDSVCGLDITDLGEGRFALNTTGTERAYMCAAPQLAYPISIWNTDDAGALWQIKENPNIEADANVLGLIDPSLLPEPDPVLGNPIPSLEALSRDSTYAIYNPTFTAYITHNASQAGNNGYVWAAGMTGDADHVVASDTYKEQPDFTQADAVWMVVAVQDSVYIYNMGAGKYLSVPTYDDATVPCTFSDEPVALSVEDLGDGTFALTRTAGEKDYLCAAPQKVDTPLSIWTKTDAGSCWQFIPSLTIPVDETVLEHLLEVTGLNTLTVSSPHTKGIYTLSGLWVGSDTGSLPQGIYIVGGRKVVVK